MLLKKPPAIDSLLDTFLDSADESILVVSNICTFWMYKFPVLLTALHVVSASKQYDSRIKIYDTYYKNKLSLAAYLFKECFIYSSWGYRVTELIK